MRSSSIFKNIYVYTFNCFGCIIVYEVVNWGRLPFSKKIRSSSIFKNIIIFTFNYLVAFFFEVVFNLKKKFRSASFFKYIEVIFHILSSLVIIRLHTKNQPPRLPGTALNVMIPAWCGGVVVVVFLTDNNTTPTKVVLSCFGLLVGLWQ